MRETLQKQLNTKLQSLKFDNVEDGWNNFRKIICQVADCVLAKKVRNAARNISRNALSSIEKRRDLYNCYLSDLTYENYEYIFEKGEVPSNFRKTLIKPL